MIYESARCCVDHQNGPGQDYWYIGDTYNSYEAPTWTSVDEMIADLTAVLSTLRAIKSS